MFNNEIEQAYSEVIAPKKVNVNPEPPYLILKGTEYLQNINSWTNKVELAKKFDILQDAVNICFEIIQKYPEYSTEKIKIVGLADAKDFPSIYA